MGKAGRLALEALLPRLRSEYAPDFVLCNGENAAGGFGLTSKVYDSLTQAYGVDCVTMGNHWHDKREIYDFLPKAERLVLPANMGNVDREELGLKIISTKSGISVAVINLIGRAFMHEGNRDPFKTVDRLLEMIPAAVKIRIVDMHAEATSEKQGLAWYLCGRVSLVYGTHSHVPTADERILGQLTGFATDIGMTGPYESVIGIKRDAAIQRLLSGEKRKFEPASGDPWLCALIVDIDETTGKCLAIRRLRWELERASELPTPASIS